MDKETKKGLLWSFIGAVATGTAFTQKMPATPDDWWVWGWGLMVATAIGMLQWKRNNGADQSRKTILSDEEREQLRQELLNKPQG